MRLASLVALLASLFFALTMTFGSVVAAHAQGRVAEASSRPEAERAAFAILATPHLGAIDGFKPEFVSPVVERIVAWQPSVIGIEALPPEEIEAMRQNEAYSEVVAAFVGEERLLQAEQAQQATGLSALEAQAIVEGWTTPPSSLDADQRQVRILNALAAYRPETALLYWDAESKAGLGQSVASYLAKLAASANERVSVAVASARALDLSSLAPIDSHLDKDIYLAVVDDLQDGLVADPEAASVTQRPPYTTQDGITREALAQQNLLPLYAFLNSQEFGRADVTAQFDLFNRVDFANRTGRVRQSNWDERNLRIAANIRRASAKRPGERVLVLIGAGHKPFLDELLAVSLDTRSVDTQALLSVDIDPQG
ncbi:MAG: DUF5694 domain-containing protein [Erythrobacter sp.]|uniref:DUF5694 domain-containing protein n=1 Tax=Erythrobacter sp. TaxID=1042 RepID=UPI00261B170B|nr:DUF5694 domain-containing protein [Erythrobacter sp.]MDJ0977321.1 DUF5694 domain-containing protein [Erythrobacter sp.]